MRELGLWAVRPKRNTSKRHPGHQVYPYLLRGKTIDQPNQVWAARDSAPQYRHQRPRRDAGGGIRRFGPANVSNPLPEEVAGRDGAAGLRRTIPGLA